MDDERERKLASLRGRVRSQLKSNKLSEKSAKAGLLERATSKISEKSTEVIEEEPLTISLSRMEREFQRFASSNRENEKLRKVAAFCILIGAIFGMVSGLMQLTGNPVELVENSQFFAIDDEVDISGIILFEDGSAFEGVIVKIYDIQSGKSYGTQVSTEDGYFRFQEIPQRSMRMEFVEEGYDTINLTFIPDKATIHYVTMHEGEGLREIGNIAESELNQAVVISTIVGIFTMLFALIGIHAYLEVKRAKHYRRTMFLAGLSMFSRGLIVVGPTFTLIGMGFLTLAKHQFNDQSIDEEGLNIV